MHNSFFNSYLIHCFDIQTSEICDDGMAGMEGSGSPEAMETTEAPAAAENSTVTTDQSRAMRQILDKVYKYREQE